MIVACGVLTATFYNSEVSGAIARKKQEGRSKKEEGRRKTGRISFNWLLQLEIRQTGRCWS